MKPSDALLQFEEKFHQRRLRIADSDTWTLSVRPGQITLGDMVLACRSGALSMAELSAEEVRGLGAGFALVERLAKDVLGAQRVNYLCLMMQDPIVHFHILPRYPAPVTRYGRLWEDVDWPAPPTITPVRTNDEVLERIRDDLCSGL